MLEGSYQKNPIDPYCVNQMFGEEEEDFKRSMNDFMDKLFNAKSTTDYKITTNIDNFYRSIGKLSEKAKPIFSGESAPQVTDKRNITSETKVETPGYVRRIDLDSNPTPFANVAAMSLLSKDEVNHFNADSNFSSMGIVYDTESRPVSKRKNTFTYDVPKTVGFYQLRDTMSELKEPFNIYMFVNDANAPVSVYDVDTPAVDASNV